MTDTHDNTEVNSSCDNKQGANATLENAKTFRDFLSHLHALTILSPEAVARAEKARHSTQHPADTILIELGLVREDDLAHHLAVFFQVPVSLALPEDTDPQLLEATGTDFLEANEIVPLRGDDGDISIAIADPFCLEPVETINYLLDCEANLTIVPRSVIAEKILALKQDREPAIEAQTLDLADVGIGGDDRNQDDIEQLRDFAREAPIVRFVSRTIQAAVDQGATDIHIEPTADNVRIRLRCDGMLSVFDEAPLAMHAGIATRLKILSRLNIAQRRLPQDGRMRVAVRGQQIDLRVSVLPSVYGETFVLRILDRAGVELELGALGYDDSAVRALNELAHVSNGVVLVTGPTGSGKTTTLYSLLKERHSDDLKIFTVEDPVEYRLPNITQLQIDPAIDLTFAQALRSVLRQDPDIILIGEIRDRESAQIAIQAALTGHLVFTTLHTNSAVGALARLRDIGIDNYLIGATIRAIIAQRLVRRTCTACDPASRSTNGGKTSGCDQCRGSGYFGRRVVYEILEVSSGIADLMGSGVSDAELTAHAKQNGLITMAQHADQLVSQGLTTREEVRRVLEFGGN